MKAKADGVSGDAASIWNDRYSKKELACTQRSISSDPIDYTQHKYLYDISTAKRITGMEDGDPLLYIAQRFLVPPAKRMLTVGCGLAFAEEMLVKGGFVEHVVAFESSSIAIENAKQRIAEAGLIEHFEFRCEDVVQAGLANEEFDLVFVQAAIHHFYNIEEMFALFYEVIKPGGLLMYDEYVGPDHHVYEEHVMEILNEVNDCLRPLYRKDVLRNEVRQEVPRATLEWTLDMDPSEGVHASRILPLTYKYFDVVDRRDYGGTLMRPFFVGILPNFDFEDDKDKSVANLLMKIEEMLLRYGVLPSYHTRVVGVRRDFPIELEPKELERINYSNWSGFDKYGALSVVENNHEFLPADHSDANWSSGIATYGDAAFFMPALRKAIEAIEIGTQIQFANGAIREVLSISIENGSLVVKISGEPLNPKETGFPNRFIVLRQEKAVK